LKGAFELKGVVGLLGDFFQQKQGDAAAFFA
jgi:hypothetical protein